MISLCIWLVLCIVIPVACFAIGINLEEQGKLENIKVKVKKEIDIIKED